MRHGKSFNHLSRKTAHRKALLANLATSLIMHKRIKTTTAKAKALKTFIEPIITRSKEDSTHSRRLAFSSLGNKYAVTELFREVSSKIGDRPGGYTRIIKIDSRHGDNADMCIIELVDFNENLLGEKDTSKGKTARKRRGKKKPAEGKAAGESEVKGAEKEGSQDESQETTRDEVTEAEGGEVVPESADAEGTGAEEVPDKPAKTEKKAKAKKDKSAGSKETRKGKAK
jgi:large subunit ribosomal protein L17